MAWEDFKGMITFMLLFSLMTYIYSTEIPSLKATQMSSSNIFMKIVALSPLTPSDNTSINYTQQVYRMNGGFGNESMAWAKRNDTTLGITSILVDFWVASWNWSKGFLILGLDFAYAPVDLVTSLLVIDNLAFLWWLPIVLIVIWTMLWSISIMSIIFGR